MSPEEVSLRQKVREKPKSAHSRAELAIFLADKAKQDAEHGESIRAEGMKLAEKSIELAPSKFFGYAAKATLLEDFDERIEGYQQALDKITDPTKYWRAKLDLSVRSFIEPRTRYGTSNKEVMRRSMDKDEEELYTSILQLLQDAPTQAPAGAHYVGWRDYHLGCLFRKMEPPSVSQARARYHFQRAYNLLPEGTEEREASRFWLATLDPDNAGLTKCPSDYVAGLYSTFAERFDDLMVEKLSYQMPKLLRGLVDEVVETSLYDKRWARRAVDLGCGTGLSGLAFRDIAQRLIGVDLSPEMIAKAQPRGCYDELIEGDLMSVLSRDKKYNLAFSCDVFCYFGDLSDIVSQVYDSLCVDGVFAFSTELLEENHEAEHYNLHACARFAHKETYVDKVTKECGFELLGKKVCVLRKNDGKDVKGLIIVLRKPSAG